VNRTGHVQDVGVDETIGLIVPALEQYQARAGGLVLGGQALP